MKYQHRKNNEMKIKIMKKKVFRRPEECNKLFCHQNELFFRTNDVGFNGVRVDGYL